VGKGKFSEEQVLSFSPSHGSSFFELIDANGDGHLDILYTAGDNADFKPILKPYHGIYLYLNAGQNQFTERFFVPLNGAYKALARDFDQDGDLDVAAVSFFPDFDKRPEEGFVYLENQGDFQFSATSFPEVELGRWITMDAGDVDGDGDEDILSGSLAFEVIGRGDWVKNWQKQGVPFIYLENKRK